MSQLRSVLAAAWLLAACSGADSTETRSTEQEAAAPGAESTSAETATLAAMATADEAAVCELPSGGDAAACNDCLAAQCCAPIEDCKSDGACSAQLRCIVECQHDPAPAECSAACAPDGAHAGYVAYDDCSFVECLSACWM